MTAKPGTIGLDLLNDSPYGAYAVNLDQIIWYWNPAAERISGYSATDAVGRPCHQVVQNLVEGSEAPVCRSGCPSLRAVREGRIPPVYDVLMLCASGQRKRVVLTPLVIGAAEDRNVALVHLFQEPDHWYSPERVAKTVSTDLAFGPVHRVTLYNDPVTARELEVLRRVAAGLTPQEISSDLLISYHTVRNHTARLRRKLGATNSLALVRRARELGLI